MRPQRRRTSATSLGASSSSPQRVPRAKPTDDRLVSITQPLPQAQLLAQPANSNNDCAQRTYGAGKRGKGDGELGQPRNGLRNDGGEQPAAPAGRRPAEGVASPVPHPTPLPHPKACAPAAVGPPGANQPHRPAAGARATVLQCPAEAQRRGHLWRPGAAMGRRRARPRAPLRR